MIELVCFAVQRQVTATWLSLFAILTAQLNPPPAFEGEFLSFFPGFQVVRWELTNARGM